MDLRRVCASIATLGPIGYMLAPGTVATLLSAPLALWVVSDAWPLAWQFSCAFCFTLFSLALIRYVLPLFKKNDPSEIVLDELVGCLFLFFNLPMNFFVFGIGIGIFRVLDTLKPFGLSRLEKMDGAWGIVLDDVCAGIMSNVLLRVLLYLIRGN